MTAPAVHRLSVPKTARWYALGALGPATRTCWIVCHGYGQLAARFVDGFAPVVTGSRAVVAPEALHRFYLDKPDRPAAERRVGATWMTREAREDDIADYVAYLERIAGEIQRAAPNARLAVLGFSQGAATVSRWAVATERDLAWVALWGAGLPPDLDAARARRRFADLPLWFVLGEHDAFATPERWTQAEAALRALGIGHRVLTYPGGHAVDPDALRRLAEVVESEGNRGA